MRGQAGVRPCDTPYHDGLLAKRQLPGHRVTVLKRGPGSAPGLTSVDGQLATVRSCTEVAAVPFCVLPLHAGSPAWQQRLEWPGWGADGRWPAVGSYAGQLQ